MRTFYFKTFLTRAANTPAGDGEGGGAGGGAGGGGEPVLTQTQVNKLLAEERRKHEAKFETKLAELAGKTVAVDAHEALKAELENLRKQSMTAAEREKLAFQQEITRFKTEAETNKSLAEKTIAELKNFKITNGLLAAATEVKAYRPSQLQSLFLQNSTLVPELDKEGKPSGKDVIQVTVPLEGKEISGTPLEVFKAIKAHPDYANFFIAEGSGGIGGSNNNGGTGDVDLKRLETDPEYYAAMRKAGRI